jgi:hypothetical protein
MAPAPRLSLVLLCACAVAVAAGCGSDDGPTEVEQITRAVERVLESDSVTDQCDTGISEHFAREVYGTRAHCREANEPRADDPAPDEAEVSATRIDGDKATTGVTLTSARGSRASGRLALVRVGDTWKVDRLGVDFLRSVFATLPKEASDDEERRVLQCVAEAAKHLGNDDVRRVGNLIVGRRLTARALPASVAPCLNGGAAAQVS